MCLGWAAGPLFGAVTPHSCQAVAPGPAQPGARGLLPSQRCPETVILVWSLPGLSLSLKAFHGPAGPLPAFQLSQACPCIPNMASQGPGQGYI